MFVTVALSDRAIGAVVTANKRYAETRPVKIIT